MKDEIFQEIANSIYSKLVGRGGEDTRLFANTIAEAIQEYDKHRTEKEKPGPFTPEMNEQGKEFEAFMTTKIESICVSVRHDFWLLDKRERNSITFQAKEYIHAMAKELPIQSFVT